MRPLKGLGSAGVISARKTLNSVGVLHLARLPPL